MERLLLVEDQALTRRALQRLLQRRFQATVDVAETEDQLREILRKYQVDGTHLDAAVLDLKIPQSKGTNADVSSACVLVQEFFPDALIGHITAHYSDSDVGEHLSEYHLTTGRTTDFFIDKRDERWEETLVHRLAGSRVEHQLDALDESRGPSGRYLQHASQRHQSATFRRAALVRDIKQYWKLLQPELKERIRRYFDVDENYDPIVVR